jgi:hypothetical protein
MYITKSRNEVTRKMNRMEIVVNSAEEMCKTMQTMQTDYPNATFENLEYLGIENGRLTIRISYTLN